MSKKIRTETRSVEFDDFCDIQEKTTDVCAEKFQGALAEVGREQNPQVVCVGVDSENQQAFMVYMGLVCTCGSVSCMAKTSKAITEIILKSHPCHPEHPHHEVTNPPFSFPGRMTTKEQ